MHSPGSRRGGAPAPNTRTECTVTDSPKQRRTASPARLGWRSPRGSPRTVRCRGALPGVRAGPSTSASDQRRTMSHHRRYGALTAGSTLTVGDWRARLRAGVWWHACTLRLVSDMGHPVRAQLHCQFEPTCALTARALSATGCRCPGHSLEGWLRRSASRAALRRGVVRRRWTSCRRSKFAGVDDGVGEVEVFPDG